MSQSPCSQNNNNNNNDIEGTFSKHGEKNKNIAKYLLPPSVFVNSFPRLGVHTKYARLGGNEAAAAPVAALLSQWCGFVGEIALLSITIITESCNGNGMWAWG